MPGTRKCSGKRCGKRLFLGQGFRCLECPKLFCRGCAMIHFGYKSPTVLRKTKVGKAGPLALRDLGRRGVQLQASGKNDSGCPTWIQIHLNDRAAAVLKRFLGDRIRRIRTGITAQ